MPSFLSLFKILWAGWRDPTGLNCGKTQGGAQAPAGQLPSCTKKLTASSSHSTQSLFPRIEQFVLYSLQEKFIYSINIFVLFNSET
jgi:hypothetical protein